MQWVAKKHLPIIAVFLPLAIGVLSALFSGTIAIEGQLPSTLTCFEPSSTTLRVTTENQCRSPLIPLGNSSLVESATATGLVVEIHPLLQNRFDAASAAAALEGVTLYITSGFRSQARQEALFADAITKYGSESEAAKWVLPARFSHHPQGLAIDVNYPKDPAGAKWLEDNGARFGLCRVYANEWWHFEAVTAPGQACPAMAENALVDLQQ